MNSVLLDAVSRRRAWLTLCGLLVPATMLLAMDRSIVTIAAPTLQIRYSLSLPQIGLIFSVFNWAYALMQIPGGAFVSRFGPRISMTVAILLWSLMTAVTPFAGSFALLLVIRVLLAIGQSPDWPGNMLSIDRLFPFHGRSVANGVLLCGLYTGVALGAPVASHLLMAFGLGSMFMACGATGIVFAAIWWALFRVPDSKDRGDATSHSFLLLGQAAKSGRVWRLAFAYACSAGMLNFYLALFPSYLAKARGMGLLDMGNYTAISSWALCPAALLAGPLLGLAVGRTSSLKAARLPFAIGSFGTIGIISAIIPLLTSNVAILIAVSVSLAALGVATVTTWSVVQDIGRTETATLTGFIALIGNLSAGVIPFVATLLVTYFGDWNSVFIFLAVLSAIGGTLWLFVDPGQPFKSEKG